MGMGNRRPQKLTKNSDLKPLIFMLQMLPTQKNDTRLAVVLIKKIYIDKKN